MVQMLKKDGPNTPESEPSHGGRKKIAGTIPVKFKKPEAETVVPHKSAATAGKGAAAKSNAG
jgi:hypothetical protein